MPSDSPAEFRADVDATVSFSNGGRIVVEGFRLDLPGPTTTDDEVAALLVAALGLLMADRVEVTRLEVVAEQHKIGRAHV